MKKNMLVKLAVCCLALQAGGAGQKALADDGSLKTEKAKTSYALGVYYGNNTKSIGLEVDTDILLKGMKDAMAGGSTSLTSNEVREILMALPAKIAAIRAREGEDFLAKNKTQSGVVTLTNGLQYKIITAGKGPMPKLADTVAVNYRGTLINGEEFDASPPGEPKPFAVSGVIPGWTQILQIMPTGSKWKVFIPSNLAYGERGAGGKIGPNSALIFDIELVAINPPTTIVPAR
jgi:FKBP-type peptidyl-prolyl cis-trans isomerase